jgi:hypothetical protein
MKAIGKTVLGLAAVLLLAGPAPAQDRDRIYGAQLMTPAERAAYRERLRSMSPEERVRFRQEHRQRMDQRARERGVQLRSRRGSDEGHGSRGGRSMGGGVR